MKYFTPILGILISSGFAASAWAEEGSGNRPSREQFRQKMLEEFDADGDGDLNEEERSKAREEMRERFGRGRRERGGPEAGGPPERGPRERGAREGGPRRGPSAERGPEGRPPRRDGPRGPQRPPMNPDEVFDTFDVDQDGQLSREEFHRLGMAFRMAQAMRMSQLGMHMQHRGGPMGPPPPRGGFEDRGPRRDRPEMDERGRGRDRPRGPRGFRGEEGDFRGPPERPRPPRGDFDSSVEEPNSSEETA